MKREELFLEDIVIRLAITVNFCILYKYINNSTLWFT